MSLSELETQVRIQNLKLKHKNREISRLQAALSLFIANNGNPEPIEIDKEQDELAHLFSDDEEMDVEADPEKNDEAEDQEHNEDDEPLKPLLDESAGLYFCTDCLAEIDEGICITCKTKYEWQEEDPLRNTECTGNQAMHHDRSLVPRGNTPLLPDDMFDRFLPPVEYRYRREGEYKELLRRGATRMMCENFRLEFSQQGGIYAWADQQLSEEFSGPAMKEGDSWKIHLGRRISLDKDDEEGSAFIEGLLEDAMLFPFRGPTSDRPFEQWETVKLTHCVWITRLKANRDAIEESMDDNDFDSDDGDHFLEVDDLYQYEDKALENPPTKDTGAIRAEIYASPASDDEEDEGDSEEETLDEDSDEEVDEDEDDQYADMGAFIRQQPDAIWEPIVHEDNEDDEGHTADDGELERPLETASNS